MSVLGHGEYSVSLCARNMDLSVWVVLAVMVRAKYRLPHATSELRSFHLAHFVPGRE